MGPITFFRLVVLLCVGSTAVAASRLVVEPAEVPPGATLRLRGEVPAGQPDLRFYWEQGEGLRAFAVGTGTRWAPLSEGSEQPGGVAQLTLPAVQQRRFFRSWCRNPFERHGCADANAFCQPKPMP